nr:hypothetical protein B0A51_03933 [Rachicladosporium sp. CCFEE 5018]
MARRKQRNRAKPATASTVIASTPPSPRASLLGLPAELRLLIYEYVVADIRSQQLTIYYNQYQRRIATDEGPIKYPLALSRTCHLLAMETDSILFAPACIVFTPAPLDYDRQTYQPFDDLLSRTETATFIRTQSRKVIFRFTSPCLRDARLLVATEDLLQELEYGAGLDQIHISFTNFPDYNDATNLAALEAFITRVYG